MNFLENTLNGSSKFRTKQWVEINDHAHEMYNANSQIKLKIIILKSNLCDYSHAQIFLKGTITITEVRGAGNLEER